MSDDKPGPSVWEHLATIRKDTEPEPVPEKPKLLLARVTMTCEYGDNPPESDTGWFWFAVDRDYPTLADCSILGKADCYYVTKWHEVNRDLSDPEALELFDREKNESCP